MICHNGQDVSSSLTNFQWVASGDLSTPQFIGTNPNPATIILKELRLDFGKNTGNGVIVTYVPNDKRYDIAAQFTSDTDAQTFILDSGTKGIKMGDNGQGIFSVDFRQKRNKREVFLNLDKVTSGDTSFEGDINIYFGDDDNDAPADAKQSQVVAKFNKHVKGNISLLHPWSQGRKSSFTFKDNASLKGSFSAQTGKNTLSFNNGSIEGDFTAETWLATNTVTFEGAGNQITGNVSALDGKNYITFKGASGSKITGALKADKNGINRVIFEGQDGEVSKSSNANGNVGIVASGGYSAKNIIEGKKLTVNMDYMRVKGNQNSVNSNTIKAEELNLKVGSIYALSASNNRKAGANANNITADTIILETQDITPPSGGNITNAKANAIYASYGFNNITAKNLTLTTKFLEANGSSSNKKITQNNITTGGDSTITIDEVKASSGFNTLTFNGGDSTLTVKSKFEATGGANTIVLQNASLKLDIQAATQPSTDGVNQAILKEAADLKIASKQLQLHNLVFENNKWYPEDLIPTATQQRNTVINLASEHANNSDFKLLTIGDTNARAEVKGLVGSNGFFKIFARPDTTTGNTLGGQNAASDPDTYGYAYSDRILVESGEGGTHYIQALMDNNTDISKIGYQGGGTDIAGNIAVATVKNDTGVTFEGVRQVVGYDTVETTLTTTATDANGKTNTGSQDYTTYLIQSMGNQGASLANQKAAAVALGANYELYLANLNSLNKRMGELRENTGAQGVWARVFNGMQSTNFSNALNTRSIYTTLQGGYDYTFGFKGASNYLGLALSYANAMGSSQGALDYNGLFKGLRYTNSNAVEFAIYNAYVQDGASKSTGWKNGFYSDSILKLSYIMSNLHFLDQGEKTYNTSNLAFSLSQELGYRFLLGNDKEFYIDPQVEMTLGFLNQGNLKQTLGGHFMDSVQDAILTLRNRVGSSFGYKFDKFTQNKGFNSSLYLGTYFVGDFITGGDISITTDSKKTLSFKPLASDMRFVLNLGTNFKIKDNTRIYFDFERSFGGRITTDYQLNLGVRYSFGTSKYTPYTEANTQEIKDNNTLKEVEPTKGYYIEVLEKEANKLTTKEKKVLEKLKDNLKVQSKTQGNKTIKVYLIGAFKDESKAKDGKAKLEGVLKEFKSKGNIIEVE